MVLSNDVVLQARERGATQCRTARRFSLSWHHAVVLLILSLFIPHHRNHYFLVSFLCRTRWGFVRRENGAGTVDGAAKRKRTTTQQTKTAAITTANHWREKCFIEEMLLVTPQISFRGKGRTIYSKEGIVTDVGSNYITIGTGSSYPPGLIEMR